MPRTKRSRLDRALNRKKALDWGLVLHAMGIPYHIRREGALYMIIVPGGSRKNAEKQIRLYEKETAARVRSSDAGSGTAPSINWFLLLSFPVLFHVFRLYQLAVPKISWTEAGFASADRILNGEWWRSVTGLFLHAHEAHYAANIVLATVIAYFLSDRLGEGLGWLLILFTGVAGNALNSALYLTRHDFIGFSTAVFGAIGILAGLEILRLAFAKIKRRDWKRIVIPLGGGFALFGLFGTSPGTDVSAHLAGLASGLLTGVIAGFILKKTGRPRPAVQIVFLAVAVAATMGSWMVALAARG